MRHRLNRTNCTCAANVPILYDATWLKQNQLYLCGEGADPDANEDMVPLQAGEDVALAVDLACVDLIEESHHDKRVEDQCEVLCRDLLQFILMAAIVNIKRHLACNNIHNQSLHLAYNNIHNQTPPRLQQHVNIKRHLAYNNIHNKSLHLAYNNIHNQTLHLAYNNIHNQTLHLACNNILNQTLHLTCNNILNQTPPRLQQHSQSNATSPTTTFTIKRHISPTTTWHNQTPPSLQQHSQSNATSPTTTFTIKHHLACNNIHNQTPPRLQHVTIKRYLACNNMAQRSTAQQLVSSVPPRETVKHWPHVSFMASIASNLKCLRVTQLLY